MPDLKNMVSNVSADVSHKLAKYAHLLSWDDRIKLADDYSKAKTDDDLKEWIERASNDVAAFTQAIK